MPTYYAALANRLLVGDGEWTERLVGETLECVAADERVPERAFVGTVDSGLQRTTDGGETWEQVLDGGDRTTSVTVSPQDPDVVWAGTEPSAAYRSADAGETWTEREGLTDLDSAERWSFPPRPDTHHVRWIAVAPDDPDRLYVAIEAGAFVRAPDECARLDGDVQPGGGVGRDGYPPAVMRGGSGRERPALGPV